jgi:hypothetical protein
MAKIIAMKKQPTTICSLVFLLSCLCTFLHAQIIPVTIIETRPEALCTGDTIEVRFVVLAQLQPNQIFKVGVRLDRNNTTLIDTLFTGTLSQLTVVDTISIGLVYGEKLKIPNQCPVGTWSVSGNILSPNQVTLGIIACNPIPQIISFSPDTLCPGDTICIKLYNPLKDSFNFNWMTTQGESVIVWTQILTSGNETDTMNYCFRTPDFLYLSCGPAFIGIDLINQWPIYIKCGCIINWLGIKQNDPNKLKPIYYDIMGNRVEPQQGMFLIEQKGREKPHPVIITEP